MAGRQIKQSKGNESYDAGRRHVFAEKIQPLPEDLKKKISLVLEAIPSRSKDEIAEALQICDYDVDNALNYFVADGEMEVQNEWKVQGKRKLQSEKLKKYIEKQIEGIREMKKKKKSGKKTPKDTIENQAGSETPQTNLNKDPTSSVQEVKESEKINTESTNTVRPSNSTPAANGKLPEERVNTVEKDTTRNPAKPLENGESEFSRINVPKMDSPMPPSPTPLSPTPLSPTESLKSLPDSLKSLPDSLKSLPDSHSLGKDKHPETNSRVRTHSTSGPEVIRKSLKDLQRSSVSIARFQSILDEEAELSTKALAKSFQALRQVLDEREKLLQEQLEAVTLETRKLLQERQEDAAGLKFKCNRVGTMTEHETTDLRNELKHFVGERRIDEDLGKTVRFIRDDEKMLEAIRSFGEVTPIKNHYTAYKRKHSDPTTATTKPAPSKPAPPKPTPSAQMPPSVDHASSKQQPPSETKGSKSRGNILSISRLKDQAEMHTRLQEALKQQTGSNAKDGTIMKKEERPADAEKQNKAKDHGWKTSKLQGGGRQQPAREPRRQQASQQHNRQTNSRNFTQNSPKSPNKHEESSAAHREGENKKPARDEKPADSVSSARDATREETPATARPVNKERTVSDHVEHQPGNKRVKRRYIRKTALEKINGGSNDFKGRNGPDKNAKADAEKSSKETGNKQESSNEDGKGIQQGENAVVNGVTPLPQRPPRGRKVYYKKDPESEVKFPPAKENGSLSNGTSRQSSVA